MKIFLIGLPGSGKTTLGIKLAKALKILFVDLDETIEKRVGKKVRKIFADSGEEEFRKIESAELIRWCNSPESFVMATGGGAPCFFNNMDEIQEAGKSIFLDVDPGEIALRMEKTPLEERPLLAQADSAGLFDRLKELRAGRLLHYSRATYTVSGNSLTIDSILGKLEELDR